MIGQILCLMSFFLGVVPTGEWRVQRHENNQPIDRSISSYEIKQKKRVDTFDFSGEYGNLENINIDGRRLKDVEVILTGDYPLLKRVLFDGGLGTIAANLTGSFPELEDISIACNAARLELDLEGHWTKDCSITLTASCGDIFLNLPKDVGVIVYSRTQWSKLSKGPLKKKGWGVRNKTYVNELYEKAPITLYINIESKEGTVAFN